MTTASDRLAWEATQAGCGTAPGPEQPDHPCDDNETEDEQ